MSDTAKAVKTAPDADKKADKAPAARYTKSQLMASEKYAGRRDVIDALLDEGKTYTTAAVDAAIKTFMDRRVK